jgi:hypothetical protein
MQAARETRGEKRRTVNRCDACFSGGGVRVARGTLRAFGRAKEALVMNLVVWLPAMFLLGLVTMTLCYAFIGACDKI